jgi:hypothetical protein
MKMQLVPNNKLFELVYVEKVPGAYLLVRALFWTLKSLRA